MSREVMQMALDALELAMRCPWSEERAKLADALREALAQQAEPVAFVDGNEVRRQIIWSKNVAAFDYEPGTPLYSTPPAQPAAPAQPVVPNLAHKPTVQHLMDLARKLRSAPGDLYDGPYKALQNACYAALSATPVVREPQPETSRLLANVADAARRLVEHADFQLGGILSADSKAKDIPSKAVSQVKARHLASLRDRVAELDAANGITGGSNG